MVEFMKKISDWILDKEEEMAKECVVDPEDIERQIEMVRERKARLEEECRENVAQLGRILLKLENIKEKGKRCNTQRGGE
jgi:Mg2+ and Co2+ transporter CorA